MPLEENSDFENQAAYERVFARAVLGVETRSVLSVDTDDTRSDLFGPGRTLGLAYGYLGRKLEVSLSRWTEGLGCGPRETTKRIERRLRALDYRLSEGCLDGLSTFGRVLGMKRRKFYTYLIQNDCRRLLEYAQ